MLHNTTGQGYVRLAGRFHYLGRFDDPATHQRYHRTIAEWLAGGHQLFIEPEEITLKELIERYLVHVNQYYCKPDGTPTSEIHTTNMALSVVRDLYAGLPVGQFGPRALIAVRQGMIQHIRKRLKAGVLEEGRAESCL